MASDLLPVCAKCGDLNPPGWRVCETCGAYLLQDDAERDLLARLDAARKRRYPQVHNSVEENLLDTAPTGDVTSQSGDETSGMGGHRVAESVAADPDHPPRLVDRGSA